jgi:hypothetical protein
MSLSLSSPPHPTPTPNHTHTADKFIWPGFGENIRVLKWIFERMDAPAGSSDKAKDSAIGWLPTEVCDGGVWWWWLWWWWWWLLWWRW